MTWISGRLKLGPLSPCITNSLRRLSSASAILNPDNPTVPLSGKQKSRMALSLLKFEKNPDTVLSICRAAALTPDTHLDRLAFSAAMYSLSSSSSFIAVRACINELLDLKNDRHRAHAIVLFGQAGLLDDAVRLFDEMTSPTLKCFNSLLFAGVVAKKHGDVARMFKEYPKAHGLEPDVDSYNNVILSFCESGSSRSVYSLLDEMAEKGVKPNVTSYNNLITGLCREGNGDDVGKVLEMMKANDCNPRVSTYNHMIKGLCKMNKSVEAKNLLEKMVKMRNVRPNVVTYQHLINGFCKESNLEEAKKLFADMDHRKGCVPDSYCYFVIIYYLCKGGEFEDALNFCKKSIEKNWVPRFTTMKTLVKGLVDCSKMEEAKEIAKAVKDKFPNNSEMWKEVDELLST